MATDHNLQERRRYPHRHRRGPDRRGPDRRTLAQQPGPRSSTDVEAIMRDIRARIAQRHGIDLSSEQIQDLAARRLDAILDPRGLPAGLLDRLRAGAGTPPPAPDPPATVPQTFDESRLYDGPGGVMRGIRRLLRPILRLFLDPAVLSGTLRAHAQVTREMAQREIERDRQQAEWNALHYEILQRLALEVARGSIEMQHLSLRVESLAGKVDFNERRVRSFEGSALAPAPRPPRAAEPAVAVGPVAVDEGGSIGASADTVSGEGPRRKRRRRRGRKPGSADGVRQLPVDAAAGFDGAAAADLEGDAEGDEGEGPEGEVDSGGAALAPDPEAGPRWDDADPPGRDVPASDAAANTPGDDARFGRDRPAGAAPSRVATESSPPPPEDVAPPAPDGEPDTEPRDR